MKKIMTLAILFNILTLCFSQTEISYRVSDYPPYYYNENGTWKGLSVELLDTLIKEAGYTSKYIKTPFKRGLIQLKQGQLDVMTNLAITEEREEYMYFVGPQMDESMKLFFLKDSHYEINSLDDIKEIQGKIGIQLGAFYGEKFNNKLDTDKDFANKFIATPSGTNHLDLVKKGRIIGYIGEIYDFYYNSKSDPYYSNLREHQYIINQDFVYFGLSKKSITLDQFEKLKEAHNRLQNRGDFNSILDKYRE